MFEDMLKMMLPGVDLEAFAADMKKFIDVANEMNERTKRIESLLEAKGETDGNSDGSN